MQSNMSEEVTHGTNNAMPCKVRIIRILSHHKTHMTTWEILVDSNYNM